MKHMGIWKLCFIYKTSQIVTQLLIFPFKKKKKKASNYLQLSLICVLQMKEALQETTLSHGASETLPEALAIHWMKTQS